MLILSESVGEGSPLQGVVWSGSYSSKTLVLILVKVLEARAHLVVDGGGLGPIILLAHGTFFHVSL